MTKLIAALKRVRIVFRRTTPMTRTVILSAIALSMAAVLIVQLSIGAERARAEELKQQAAQLEQDNDRLEENIGDLGSADSVEQIAKDELGMVDPDTVVVTPQK